MYFTQDISKNMIVKEKGVSKKFVIKWTQSPKQDFSLDGRGWRKGMRRKWNPSVEGKIKDIFSSITTDPRHFYTGATAIQQEWLERYQEDPPPLRTIGRILSDLGLSQKRGQQKQKGAAQYLCYPEHTIYTMIGERVLEADFIGKKYMMGRTQPLNFLGFSFKKEPRLRFFTRVEGQTTDALIKTCAIFFERFEKPDCIKLDNSATMIGSISGKRSISRAMSFFLEHRIAPVFAVPRKPFSQASIEGNNSVFSRKFWNRIVFHNIQEVDEKLEWFNIASERYTGYTLPQHKEDTDFMPKMYFIRQVREEREPSGRAFIDILNDKVFLPSSYINYFVLAEWNLVEEQLSIRFEREQKSEVIEQIRFPINERSKKYRKGW